MIGNMITYELLDECKNCDFDFKYNHNIEYDVVEKEKSVCFIWKQEYFKPLGEISVSFVGFDRALKKKMNVNKYLTLFLKRFVSVVHMWLYGATRSLCRNPLYFRKIEKSGFNTAKYYTSTSDIKFFFMGKNKINRNTFDLYFDEEKFRATLLMLSHNIVELHRITLDILERKKK